MSRDRTRTRDRPGGAEDPDTEFDIGEDGARTDTGTETQTGSGSGLRGRLSTRAGELFSPRLFLLALLLAGGGLFAVGTLVPIPGAGLLGILVGTFLFGLAVGDRRYPETVLAGGVAAAASALSDFALVAFLGGFGLPLVALSGGLGAVLGGLGTYFGRDLRDGLTREI
jgi:hypothetical protein